MSQFEYVFVAVALVMSLAIARLLGGLSHTSAKDRGAPVVRHWIIGLILAGLTSWWVLWRFSNTSWTPLGFMWVVTAASLLYLRAAVLLTDNPSQVASWESHYFEVHRRFLGIGVAVAIHSAFLPWVVGAVPRVTPAPVRVGLIVNLPASLIGLMSTSRPVHMGLALILILQIGLFLFFTPVSIGVPA